MAHSNNGVIAGKLNGSLGKEIVFRDWAGKTVVAKAPKKRKGDPTPEQAETQGRFLVASRYARAVLKSTDQSLATAYRSALRLRQNVYSRALEDFMKPPVVQSIEARNYKGIVGDTIVARATDDFRVTSVRVEIYSANGTLLEAGNAVIDTYELDWTYTATQPNNLLAGSKIKVIATDVPNNEGIKEITL
jgi:hypothetical protein